jgi:hypothetical protein
MDCGQKLRDFVSDNEIQTLNVAVPRASNEPEVGEFVKEVPRSGMARNQDERSLAGSSSAAPSCFERSVDSKTGYSAV